MNLSDATAFESTARGTAGEGAEAGEPTYSFPSGAHWYGKCGMCGKVFPNKRSATQHERLVHPEEYHRTRVHELAKSGWPDDELVLVAREENRLVARARSLCGDQTYYPRVNQDLFRAFPGRSADAIRCLRKTKIQRGARQTGIGWVTSRGPDRLRAAMGDKAGAGGKRFASTPRSGSTE